MNALQQGWVFCADGYGWLQRLTANGVLGTDGLCVDLSQLSGPPTSAGPWADHLGADGWYRDVPAAMVNELAALHGGIVDALSSHAELGPL
ncbi:hypothetical protein [Kribbella sp. CA-293567]|uniref:hypothetical protein n=1 Tax=Kribbella sp. CA-293567 TaxID=3002436 RepID=UPI0022DDC44D|nr:hypothetical protein [Kribbella sp. CA-293567]WBQ03835.1 hypothetical protein OX958_28175 [Kribbella sp. CA-293567]